MAEKKPNHICKNINCHKGTDGGRKKYYACDFCTRSFNWRSIACSFECYQEYMNQVIEARSKNQEVEVLAERIDMTQDEVRELMERPEEEVLEETKEQLKDYIGENEENVDLSKIVDTINEELDRKAASKSRKRKSSDRNIE